MIDVEQLLTAGRQAGLHAVGVCHAKPFVDASRILHERKRAGLHSTMQFTYRNPDRSTDPDKLLPGASTLIVGALDYHSQESPERIDGSKPWARVAAYSQADYYSVLRQSLEIVASMIRAAGYKAVVSADENHLVDRAVAHRAGIGWWGKSASILVPGAGSMVVLGAVVTDAPVDYQKPELLADGCGPCRRCIDGCPTGAIIAPGTVDARRCLAWLLQAEGVFDPRFRVALGDRIYGCDDCSEVCPPNRVRFHRSRRQRNGSDQSLKNKPEDHTVSSENVSRVPVLDMLAASDSELMATYGRWYIPKRQPRYLRRNALVVLGNIADPSQPDVRMAVERALTDRDPLIVAHAVWCAKRLGLGFVTAAMKDDPMVAAEMERDVPQRADL